MAFTESPQFSLEIDHLFARIKIPVDKFIVGNGLSIDRMQSDPTVWILTWNRPDNLQRVIQIGATVDKTYKPILMFTAYAYEDSPTDPPQRNFSNSILVGSIDEEMMDNDSNLPLGLLNNSFNTANTITAI